MKNWLWYHSGVGQHIFISCLLTLPHFHHGMLFAELKNSKLVVPSHDNISHLSTELSYPMTDH